MVSHVAGRAALFFLGDQVGHDCGLEELVAEQETNEGPVDHDQRDEQGQILCPGILQCLQHTWDVLYFLLDRYMNVSYYLRLVLRTQWLNEELVIEL